MRKVKTTDEVAKIIDEHKKEGKRVGLVTGGFDILHMGHLQLFRDAKRHVDILVVGLDNDESVRKTKGNNRPVNSLKRRADFLSELKSIDYIFQIEEKYGFGTKKADLVHQRLLKKLKPTHLATHKGCDRYWKNKKKRAEELGIVFLLDKRKRIESSSNIIKKIESEL